MPDSRPGPVYTGRMSSDLTGLPPSALARLNASANSQAIAVRLLNLPDGLKNNPPPLKLQGTVTGQNPDGSVQLKTDRGVINLMLKDRQPLPQGQRLEIEIPAGRSPQQAQIRQAPAEPAPTAPPPATAPASGTAAASTAPSLVSQLTQALGSAAAALRLDRGANVRATEIEDALKAATTKLSESGSVKAAPAPLQAGQNVRLLPVLPGQSQSIPVQPGMIQALPQDALLAALTSLIEQLPADQQAVKAQLTTLLTRTDLTSLQIPSPDGKAPPSLPPQLQALLQTSEGKGQPTPQGVPQNTIRYEPILSFNGAKPADVQITGLMTLPLRPGSPLPVLPGQIQVASPVMATPSGQPSPVTQPLSPTGTPVSLQAPASGGLSSPTTQPAQIIPAQVTGFTTNNLPLISLTNPATGQPQIYVGQFQAGNLQVGSPLLLTLLPDQPAVSSAIPAQTSGPIPLSNWLKPGSWDSLDDLLQTMHQINPAAAHSFAQLIPSPSQPQNLGALALLFLSVMKSGDLESWMPPQMAMMMRQTGKTDALRAVTSDLTLTSRAENAALPQEWRATILPLYHEQQIHKVPLYYKRHQEDEDDGKDSRDRRNRMMRFLFDLRLARMGNVQIDGFMQHQRLDMIMRTKAPLSVPMQRTMQGLYTKAMEKSNLAGELTFQFKPEHWVAIDIPVTKEEVGARA